MRKLIFAVLLSCSFFSLTSCQEKSWDAYFKTITSETEINRTVEEAVKRFNNEESTGLAVDFGCGAGHESVYLAQQGWTVIAVDREAHAEEYVRKLAGKHASQIQFVESSYEDYVFPESVQLINASYALPYCPPEKFHEVMENIKAALAPGGRFAGHFFGPNDSWSSETNKVFLSRAQIEKIFKDGFEIEYYLEEDEEGETMSGSKHWHLHHLVVRKD